MDYLLENGPTRRRGTRAQVVIGNGVQPGAESIGRGREDGKRIVMSQVRLNARNVLLGGFLHEKLRDKPSRNSARPEPEWGEMLATRYCLRVRQLGFVHDLLVSLP